MSLYVVESFDWQILHGGHMSDGALGQGGGPEKIYLHVIDVSDEQILKLAPRVDDDDNRQSDRLALPRNDEWWIAVEGRKVWPKTYNPKLTSTCEMGADGIPRARPLTDAGLATLKKLGVGLPTA
jgi:hypothetical protein